MWNGVVHVRARPWAGVPRCAFLVVGALDDLADRGPTISVVESWLATLADWGYERVRTNAVPPAVAGPLADAGFSVAQELALLRRDHDTPPRFDIPRDVRPSSPRRLSSHLADVLDLDSICFGEEWSLDDDGLDDALNATTASKVWLARNDDVLEGFAVAGLTGRTGYLQRLAVHPSVRRSGVGSRLVARSLQWTHRRGARRTLVNTDVGNQAALALYDRFGFERLPAGLRVMERSIHDGVDRGGGRG